jgi:hypothetical protein
MSIKETKEQIAALDAELFYGNGAVDGLRALADSHTALLEAAKTTIADWGHDTCGGVDCGFDVLHATIRQAEEL